MYITIHNRVASIMMIAIDMMFVLPIKQPVHREDDGDRLTGKSNLMRVSLTLKLFNPIAFFLLGNFYMIILSCATHCVENHDHSNKPCLKGLS